MENWHEWGRKAGTAHAGRRKNMDKTRQRFGGDWTEEKLQALRKYLAAYTAIMAKRNFRFAYIDAFAGTGYREARDEENPGELLLPELAADDAQAFVQGSARIALEVRPRFDKYIFVEKDPSRFAELQKLRDEFESFREDVQLVNEDANPFLGRICSQAGWDERRAVLFLDPFGMQVVWDTIKAIANTKAIDLWLLFPLGIAVNRLLRRDGKISETHKQRLNDIFGTDDWYGELYQTKSGLGLFGAEERIQKVRVEEIGKYYVKRLQTLFAGVAPNPMPLYNSRRTPLYLLCFAAANPKGAPTAVKIARHILGS